jgi:hypothetical protein
MHSVHFFMPTQKLPRRRTAIFLSVSRARQMIFLSGGRGKSGTPISCRRKIERSHDARSFGVTLFEQRAKGFYRELSRSSSHGRGKR